MAKKIKVEKMPNADYYDPRWVVVDEKTGKVLDSAQGYGYKSPQKAHAAWNYKHFSTTWADVALDCYKNGEEPGYQDFKELVNEVEPDFDGNIMSLFYYVQKH